ncbi:hypothetical protein D3C76_1285490 [compost metagenome]
MGVEYITSQAFGMYTYKHWLIAGNIAFYQSYMLFIIHFICISNGLEISKIGRKSYRHFACDELFFFVAIMNKILDTDQLKIMLAGNFD